MRGDHPPRGLWLPLGVACAAWGHMISYLLAFPDELDRAAHLAATGHGYWSVTTVLTAMLGLGGTVGFLIACGRRAARHGSTGHRPGWRFAARLAVLQLTVYAGLEVAERATSGASFRDLWLDGLLLWGVASQLVVALLATVLLRWLVRAAEMVGRSRLRFPHRRVVATYPRPASARLPRVGVAPAFGARGPPSGRP